MAKRGSASRAAASAGLRMVLVGAITAGASAAQEQDLTWPCQQRKVPKLSVAQMWSGPMPSQDWHKDRELKALAARIAQRRVPIPDARAAAQAWVEGLDPEARSERIAELFAAVLDRVNHERGEIIAGIGRYAQSQADLAARVNAMEAALVKLEVAPADEQDSTELENLRTGLAWETRIYRERAQSLTYVCETPVLLERRAFDIARALSGLI